jgi:hypothetical protein
MNIISLLLCLWAHEVLIPGVILLDHGLTQSFHTDDQRIFSVFGRKKGKCRIHKMYQKKWSRGEADQGLLLQVLGNVIHIKTNILPFFYDLLNNLFG